MSQVTNGFMLNGKEEGCVHHCRKLYSFTQSYSGGCLDYSESLIDSTEPAERRVSTGRVGTQSPQINWNPVLTIPLDRILIPVSGGHDKE